MIHKLYIVGTFTSVIVLILAAALWVTSYWTGLQFGMTGHQIGKSFVRFDGDSLSCSRGIIEYTSMGFHNDDVPPWKIAVFRARFPKEMTWGFRRFHAVDYRKEFDSDAPINFAGFYANDSTGGRPVDYYSERAVPLWAIVVASSILPLTWIFRRRKSKKAIEALPEHAWRDGLPLNTPEKS